MKESNEFKCSVCGVVITDIIDFINLICTPCRIRIAEELFQKFEGRREQYRKGKELSYAKNETKRKKKA